MALAALGHDLHGHSGYKHAADVEATYGKEVDRLIEGVTERAGVAEFVAASRASGSEEVRLINVALTGS